MKKKACMMAPAVAAGLFLVASAWPALAAQPKKAIRAKKPDLYLSRPFDVEFKDGALPTKLSHDFSAMLASLKKADLSGKSEFETTVDFENRKQKFAEKTLYGEVKAGSTVAFSFDINGESYDADARKMTIPLRLPSRYYSDQSSSDLVDAAPIEIVSVDKDLGTYRAQNAFGVKWNVERSYVYRWEVALKDAGPLRKEFAVEMDSHDAFIAKDLMSGLIIGKLAWPYYAHDRSRSKVTMDDPYDVTTESEALIMESHPRLIIFRRVDRKIVLDEQL